MIADKSHWIETETTKGNYLFGKMTQKHLTKKLRAIPLNSGCMVEVLGGI